MKPALLLTLMAFLMAAILAVAACEPQEPALQKPFVIESPASPSSPISVKLTTAAFTEPPKAGSETDLIMEVSVHPSYNRTLPNATANIGLPEGIELISGHTQWNGALSSEAPIVLTARVKFVKEGNWSLSASAKSYFTEDSDSWYGNAADICYSVSEATIAQKSGECPTKTNLPPGVQETKPSPDPSPDECTSDSDCGIGGCSGQVCTAASEAAGLITTCEYREEYGCYKLTSCGCVNGRCAWRESAEFKGCVDAARSQQQLLQQEQPQ